MKCHECGSDRMTTAKRVINYPTGVKGITIEADVRTCSDCGEEAVGIFRMGELHRLIAENIARADYRLNGEEIRFLRKTIEWSATQMAKHFDTTKSTVSRWESDTKPMGHANESLLRICALQAIGKLQSVTAVLGERTGKRGHLHFAVSAGHWHLADLPVGAHVAA